MHQSSSASFIPLSLALKQKAALLGFLDISDWKNPVAITLTMKQGQFIGGAFAVLTPDLCTQNLRHVSNVLNRKAFGKASRKRKMKCVAVRERSKDGRYHYHLVLDRPEQFGDFRFRFMVEAAWRNSRWGHRQSSYESLADQGWVSYIAKLKSKPNYLDAFDWENTQLA